MKTLSISLLVFQLAFAPVALAKGQTAQSRVAPEELKTAAVQQLEESFGQGNPDGWGFVTENGAPITAPEAYAQLTGDRYVQPKRGIAKDIRVRVGSAQVSADLGTVEVPMMATNTRTGATVAMTTITLSASQDRAAVSNTMERSMKVFTHDLFSSIETQDTASVDRLLRFFSNLWIPSAEAQQKNTKDAASPMSRASKLVSVAKCESSNFLTQKLLPGVVATVVAVGFLWIRGKANLSISILPAAFIAILAAGAAGVATSYIFKPEKCEEL